jgi:biotin transport system substrate-specific component
MNFYLGKTYSINKAIVGGFLLFLPWDLIKATIDSIIAPKIMNRIANIAPIYTSND